MSRSDGLTRRQVFLAKLETDPVLAAAGGADQTPLSLGRSWPPALSAVDDFADGHVSGHAQSQRFGYGRNIAG